MKFFENVLNPGGVWNIHRRKCRIRNRKGHVAIVTGGARGIGLEVVRQFLAMGMHVVIACRSVDSITDLLDKLRSEFPDGKVEGMTLDLLSLDSVRNFVDTFLKTGLPLHILVNNAGIMLTPYNLTNDAFESQLCVNYLAPFLLTGLLLPKLKGTGNSEVSARIVNVSSVAAYAGNINFDDLHYKKFYSASGCYSQSKLAQIMHAASLQEKLSGEGAHVTISSLHPGVVFSDLYQHEILVHRLPFVFKPLFKSQKQGADSIVHVAASSKLEGIGGKFYLNCLAVKPPKLVLDEMIRRRLWDESCRLLSIAVMDHSEN